MDKEKIVLEIINCKNSRELIDFIKNFIHSNKTSNIKIKYCAMGIRNQEVTIDGEQIDIKKGKDVNFTNLNKGDFSTIKNDEIYLSSNKDETNVEIIIKNTDYLKNKFIYKIILKHMCSLIELKAIKLFSLRNKDDLTGLYNQNYLRKYLFNKINCYKKKNKIFSVVFFDIDNLREINLKYGHISGSELLKDMAQFLKESFRESDMVARFGGDEFILIIDNPKKNSAEMACSRFQTLLNQNIFKIGNELKIKITGSFGIAQFPKHGTSPEELINQADIAMYEAKKKGKNCIYIFQGD